MKKIIHKLHLLPAIPLGIIISILCITGAILVFESELKEWCSPALYKASGTNRNEALPIQVLMPIVKRQLPDSITPVSVQIPANPTANYRISTGKQGHAALLVDPYNGQIKGEVSPYAKGTFFSFVRRLHRWFLFENKRDGSLSPGKMVTGTATLFFVFILISGAIIWIPRSSRQLKTRLRIHTGQSRFRFWYDTHLAGGIYALVLLLVISLTALTWSFSWYRNAFYALLGAEQKQAQTQTTQAANGRPSQQNRSAEGGEQRRRGRQSTGEPRETNYAMWDKVVHQLQDSVPTYKSISIEQGKATVSIHRTGNTRATNSYAFHPRTGQITEVSYYKDQPRQTKIRGWIYSLHVGSWGGIATRILYFIACLIGATLPLSGYYIYWKKRKTKHKKKHEKRE